MPLVPLGIGALLAMLSPTLIKYSLKAFAVSREFRLSLLSVFRYISVLFCSVLFKILFICFHSLEFEFSQFNILSEMCPCSAFLQSCLKLLLNLLKLFLFSFVGFFMYIL